MKVAAQALAAGKIGRCNRGPQAGSGWFSRSRATAQLFIHPRHELFRSGHLPSAPGSQKARDFMLSGPIHPAAPSPQGPRLTGFITPESGTNIGKSFCHA